MSEGSEYAALKRQHGICTYSACREDARPGHKWCAYHAERERLRIKAKYASDPSHRRAVIAWQQRKYRNLKRIGSCVRCDRPAVTGTCCQAHRDEMNRKARARLPQPSRIQRCSVCRQQGHRIETCPVRAKGKMP